MCVLGLSLLPPIGVRGCLGRKTRQSVSPITSPDFALQIFQRQTSRKGKRASERERNGRACTSRLLDCMPTSLCVSLRWSFRVSVCVCVDWTVLLQSPRFSEPCVLALWRPLVVQVNLLPLSYIHRHIDTYPLPSQLHFRMRFPFPLYASSSSSSSLPPSDY